MSVAPTRRERLRAATIDEIHSVARGLLVREGPAGVTLRAIGREMGMTAPALYRYYPSLDDLMLGLITTFYDECRLHLETVLETMPDAESAERMFTACREFRSWSNAHPAEFTLMFASTAGGKKGGADHEEPDEAAHAAGMRFAGIFIRLFVEMSNHQELRVPADEAVEPTLRAEFASFLAEHQIPLSAGAMQAFMSAWIRLYGMVALDVFGHLHFCISNGDSMFESELSAIGRELGVRLPQS